MDDSKMMLDTPIITDAAKRMTSMKVSSSDVQSIATHFAQFLHPQFAYCQILKKEAFKIRHNVYCEELGFEPIRLDGLEQDEFDGQSKFVLIKHKPSDVFTGCIRLVESLNENERLPIEQYCRESIEHLELDPVLFKRDEICEVSRLAVRSNFRRQSLSGTRVISDSFYSENELRSFQFIPIGLYIAAAILAIETGKKHVYVMMEPRLARSMRFVGIKFIQIGKPIDYHGLRAPYYITPEIFLDNLKSGFKSLYVSINKDITAQITHT